VRCLRGDGRRIVLPDRLAAMGRADCQRRSVGVAALRRVAQFRATGFLTRRSNMRLHHIAVVAMSLLLSSPVARAQAPADPTGHWEGSLDARGTDVAFQVDFAKNAAGGFI